MSQGKSVLIFIKNKREEVNLTNYFKASACAVKIARELSDFRNYLKNTYFDFILFDSSIREYGDEMLRIVNNIKTPYFYLSDGNDDNFLPIRITKPYAFSNIVTLMQEKIGPINFDPKVGEQLFTEGQYTSVKIEDIVNLKIAPFDYFIKINDQKYVKVAKEGMKVPTEILVKFQGKGLYIIYAKKDDYLNYLEKITQSSLNIKKLNIPKEMKVKFLAKTSDMIMEQIMNDGISKEMFYSSKQILDSSIELITEDDNVFNLLKSLNDLDSNTYRHSLAMAIYSVLIAKQLTWETEGNIFKISLGALFADIGLKKMPIQVLENAHLWIDGPDLENYKQHPLISAEILKQSKDIHQDILDIVSQHHENCDGTGYPKQLTRQSIHPLARVVRLSHEFVEQALKSEHNPNPSSPETIIQRLLTSGNKKFDYLHILALANAYNIKPANYTKVS